MNPREHDIRTALEATLSGVQRDPTLFDRIISDQKGAPAPMKRKLTLSMALVLALVLITGTVACSAAWRGVSAFLSNPDPDYLVTGFPQHHNSDRLDARVVDAYWDGLEFFVACRIAPADPSVTLTVKGSSDLPSAINPPLGGFSPTELLLAEPWFLNLTAPDGSLTGIDNPACTWVMEADGAVSMLISFRHERMQPEESISIPLLTCKPNGGAKELDMLHCSPPVLKDPLAGHEHQWAEATCQHPMTCPLCTRTSGDVGPHVYLPDASGQQMCCTTCGKAIRRPTHVPSGMSLHPGDSGVFVLALQLKLAETGHAPDRFTAVYDDATVSAMAAWQACRGLTADGICHRETTELLFRPAPADN